MYMQQYHLARMLLGILEFYDEQQEENMVNAKYSLLTYFIFGLEYHYQFLKGQNRNHGSFSMEYEKAFTSNEKTVQIQLATRICCYPL